MGRIIKRLFIILIYLVILALLVLLVYSLVKSKPTCFDGEKNQGEERIDCGGPCRKCEDDNQIQALTINGEAFVFGGPGKYDVVAKVFNPNSDYGSPKFSYELILKDSTGSEIARRTDTGFILPVETKYIIETGLETEKAPSDIEINITDVQWEEFIDYEKPKLNIYNKRYDKISSGTGYGEAFGLLRNESPFDFNLIEINVILKDSSGNPIALNSTDMRTVGANEERDFRLVWPSSFPGEVQGVEMEAEADIFSNDNFIRKYLPGGRFQNYE